MSPNPRSNKFAVHSFCKIVPHSVAHIRIASLILLCISLSACGVSTSNPAKSITSTPPSSPNSANPTVSVSPGTASVPSSGQQQFTAIVTNTSNTAVTWSASQGAVTQSGLFTAPAVTSVQAVTVTAACVSYPSVQAVTNITVVPTEVSTLSPLMITTETLANATATAAYSQTLSAAGGTPPYSWTIVSGSLPAEIQLNDSSGVISGTTTQTGQFNFTIQVADSSSSQQVVSVPLGVNVQTPPSPTPPTPPTSTPPPGPGIPATFFGMHVNRFESGVFPYPTIPFSGYRTLDSSILWSDLETSAGTYDFTRINTRLAAAQVAGVDVVYSIYNTPSFHSSKPTDATCATTPNTGPGGCDPPVDINPDGSGTDASLIAFLTALVNDVGTQIKYYEIWNEVNITTEWTGTNAQLLRIAQDARATILAANPNAMFLSPSFTNLTYPKAAAMEAAYLATSLNGSTGSQAADIINFHGYVVTPALPVAEAENEVVNLNNLQAVLSSTDLAKPLWDTEFSYGPAGLGDPDLNSAFIAKHLLIQAGQGIARAFYFDWDIGEQEALWSDTLTDCLEAGTPNSGGYLCETGTAYQQVETWLLGNTVTQPCSGPLRPQTGVWTCGIMKANGAQALAVWDSSQTCSAGSCTTSTYNYTGAYTQFFTLANVNGGSVLSGGSVQIGVKPILLSQ
jgi:polysaccharide biosynthesis protein PslG